MAEVKKRDLTMVPFENLKIIEGFNIRTDYGDIPLLASQIEEHGVKVPLQGYKEKGTEIYVVKDGHRRYAALVYLKEKGRLPEEIFVPFVLEPQKYNEEQRIVDMFIMNEGKPLTPLEQAECVRRLQNFHYSDTEIAKKIGRSQPYVSKLSSLNTAPKKLINLIEKGRVAASYAMDIIAKGEVEQFLQDVEDGKYDQQMNGNEMFPASSSGKTKITKANVQPVNSWREFKRFSKKADEIKINEEKANFFKFLMKILNNELSEEQIKRWFK